MNKSEINHIQKFLKNWETLKMIFDNFRFELYYQVQCNSIMKKMIQGKKLIYIIAGEMN